MPMVYRYKGITPVVHPDAFVHPSAVLIGDVIVGANCLVAPHASLRGDLGRLILEPGSNIQDCCVMHGYPSYDTVVGADTQVGHGAILHGCRIAPRALIGMNAVVMDEAEVGEDAIVAGQAFVRAGFKVPPRTLVAGVPAKILRELTDEELAWKGEGVGVYHMLARTSRATMTAVEALTEIEPDRPRIALAEVGAQPLHQRR